LAIQADDAMTSQICSRSGISVLSTAVTLNDRRLHVRTIFSNSSFQLSQCFTLPLKVNGCVNKHKRLHVGAVWLAIQADDAKVSQICSRSGISVLSTAVTLNERRLHVRTIFPNSFFQLSQCFTLPLKVNGLQINTKGYTWGLYGWRSKLMMP